MRELFGRLFFAFVFLVIGIQSFSQDTTSVAKPDSVKSARIQFTHYYSQEQWSSVNFLRVFNNRDNFLPSNGVNVFNVIRAQLPNLAMPPTVFQAVATVRADIASNGSRIGYLVDGVPFNANIGMPAVYNLNSFEFSSISSASNANALTLFDLQGGGALLLKSRDGLGYKKASFEFNTYFTNAWGYYAASVTSSSKELWLTSHSFAYMQDFGKVDTRVSYNLSTESSGLEQGIPSYHSLKVNTGVDFTEKLNVRIILEDRFNSMPESNWFPTIESRIQNYFQANVMARYRAFDWLELSGQWVTSKRDSIVKLVYDPFGKQWDRNDDRNMWNMFANFRKTVGGSFLVTGLAGIQSNAMDGDMLITSFSGQTQGTFSRSRSIRSQSFVGGTDLAFRKLLNLSFQYKFIDYESVSSGERSRSSFSVGAGLNFSELLHWSNLPLGRLRFSYGEGYQAKYASYPHPTFARPSFGRLLKNWEFGTDIGLIESKLDVTINYFQSLINTSTSTRAGWFVISQFGDFIEEGWEGMLRYHTVTNNNRSYRSSLVVSTYTQRFVPEAITPSRFVRIGLFNELKARSITLGILLEHNISTGIFKANSLKLRDITVSHDFRSMKLNSKIKVNLSLTGRNLVEFFAGPDYEDLFRFDKSISLGFNLVF